MSLNTALAGELPLKLAMDRLFNKSFLIAFYDISTLKYLNQVNAMTTKLSRMYNMDIFTDSGKFLGNAQDFIVDVESGEVSRILVEALPPSKEDAKKALREKSVLYKNVKSVEDVIVVTRGVGALPQE